MELNICLLGLIIVVAIVLIYLIIKENLRDKKEYTEYLNNDYPKFDKDDPEFNDTI